MSFKFYDRAKLINTIKDVKAPDDIDYDLVTKQDIDDKDNLHAKALELEARVPRVFEMLLYEKLTHKEFRKKAAGEFHISFGQADLLWRVARERLKEKFAERGDEIVEQQLARMFDLLRRCRKDGNKKVERELLADLNKIYGLEHRRIDITSGGDPIQINISVE